MVDQQGNVVCSLPQCRYIHGNHIEAKKEVPPEDSSLDGPSKIGIGRGNDPNIDPDWFVTPHPLDLSFLNNPEQLCLQIKPKGGNPIQKDGSPVGELEPSDGPALSIGEGPFLVSEHLAFHKL